ncbi:MAG: hypothetical protein HY843_06210 [Bdellovibrio sp.]|nr:hypothetical protein [Bdellovibrio sp.]
MLLLKLSIQPWKKFPFTYMFAACALAFLISIFSFLFWFERHLNPLIQKLRTEQVITAYLDNSIDQNNQPKIIDTIKTMLGSQVIQIKPTTQDEFLKEMQGAYPDLVQEIDALSIDKNKIIPQFISIYGYFQKQTIEKLKLVSGIELIETSKIYNPQEPEGFMTLVRFIKISLVSLFLMLCLWLILMTKFLTFAIKSSYAFLRLSGGGVFFLKIPLFLSSLWIGLLGTIISSFFWYFAITWIIPRLHFFSIHFQSFRTPSLYTILFLLVGCLGLSLVPVLFCKIPESYEKFS